MAEQPKPLAPAEKVAEAQALWEIALLYIAMSAAAQTMSGVGGSAANVAAGGAQAGRLLARAYYRLMRAIFTGYTFADRDNDVDGKTSLKSLYSDFETLAYRSIPKSKHADVKRRVKQAPSDYEAALEDILPERVDEEPAYSDDTELAQTGQAVTKEDGDDYAAEETDDDDWDDEERIIVERLEAAEQHLRDVEAAEKQELKDLDARIKEIEKRERDTRREELKQAKRRQLSRRKAKERRSAERARRAGAVMKAAQQGARTEVRTLAESDPRAIGYVRVPHSANPCGWCLMLASRGIILYKSKQNALNAWHDNCHCTAEPVFSKDYYYTSPTFAKNRALAMMWKDIARGKGAKGVTAWRSHFRGEFANGKNLTGVLRENARAH